MVKTALRHTTIAIVPGEAPPVLCCLHCPTRPPALHYHLSMLQCRFPHSSSWSPMVWAQGTFFRVVVRLQAMATTSSHTPICQERCGIQGLVQLAELRRLQRLYLLPETYVIELPAFPTIPRFLLNHQRLISPQVSGLLWISAGHNHCIQAETFQPTE